MIMPPADAPLRDKLAQLMLVRIGSNLPPIRTVEEDEERLAKLLSEVPLGGLIVFNGNHDRTPGTLERLQAASKYPLLVAADLERGVGQQLRGYPLTPHLQAFETLGAGASVAVSRFAELTAAAARAAGVHVNFAPVADVNSDPRNPIIATRSFAADPARAAELVADFVAACRGAGGLCAAKHFPGHGDTHEDSHHAVPSVDQPRETLLARELVPFRAAIAAGTPLIMTAHVRYPALDPTGTPATLSRPILTDLLRGELGFKGAVVTDSLLMEGVKAGCKTEGELTLKALNAGVDLLLDVADPVSTLNELEAFVAAGRLDPARIDEALGRMAALKQIVFNSAGLPPYDGAANLRDTEALAADVARRATVVLKSENEILPLSPDRSLCAIFVNPYQEPQPGVPQPLGSALAERFPKLDYHEVGPSPSAAQLAELSTRAAAADQRLLAFIVKPAAWFRFGLRDDVAACLQAIAERRPSVAACLGVPQGLAPFSAAAGHICTYSDVYASQRALVERLTAS